jgi:spermidine/putrescine transport system permease protein
MLGLLRRVITPEVYAISTVLLAVSVVAVTISFFLNRKRR